MEKKRKTGAAAIAALLVLLLAFGGARGEETPAAPERTATETPARTPEPTLPPAETPAPEEPFALAEAFEPQDSGGLVTEKKIIVEEYLRPVQERILMPAGDEYTKVKIGVITFRGNAFRQNPAAGTVKDADRMRVAWAWKDESAPAEGYSWTGQPVIVKWSKEVRPLTNITEEKKEKAALREVIAAGADGRIRFLDLEDGTETRGPVDTGAPLEGTPGLHPAGYPCLDVSRDGLRLYNLYDQTEMGTVGSGRFVSSLTDRISRGLVSQDSRGSLYLTNLNEYFDYKVGILTVSPVTVALETGTDGQEKTAAEAPHAMYDRFAFCADMNGVVKCVDTDTLTVVWACRTEDSVAAAVALDMPGEDRLDLYTANLLNLRGAGDAQVRRINAVNGEEIWCTGIPVEKGAGERAGFEASPVIGRKGLEELVYFTVTDLCGEGRDMLGVRPETEAALVALEKEDGTISWVRELSARSGSSPAAVYDGEGNGWIIQCAQDGMVLLLDGLTGEESACVSLDGEIRGSPAVYNNFVIVPLEGSETGARILALRIGE
jgi:outer membrane protein assembly factor BamB